MSLVFVKFSLADFLEIFQRLFVLVSDVGDCNGAGLFEANELSQESLGLDNAVRNFLVSAQVRQPEDELNWVNIGGNDDQFGLLLLYESGNVVESAFEEMWLLFLYLFFVDFVFSLFLESFSFFLFVLWLVFLQKREKSLLLIRAHCVGELVDDSWDLESVEEDFSLSLEQDVFWPLDVSCQVSFLLDVVANFVISLFGLEEIFILGDFLVFLLCLDHRL